MDAGLDLAAVSVYLRDQQLSEARAIRTELISGGRSNLTYLLDVDGVSWVLRRPPLGQTLATAHDMSREYRVMAALEGSQVPVPAMVDLCEDPGIIGTPFYIMQRAPGTALRELRDVELLTGQQRANLVGDLISVLATLHQVDPEQVGLSDFGRPDGFMSRQVRRWTTQLTSTLKPTPAMARLADALAANVPSPTATAILHGDYRLDNCLSIGGRITAVLDWEMSTLGDPLSDLAMFAVYHDGLADLPNPVVQAPGRLPGCLPIEDLLERYALQTGNNIHDFAWYQGFAWFKLAVILAGVDQRASRGQTAGQEFAGVHDLIVPCIERGTDYLAAMGRAADTYVV
jgi:aminoglycoside phosphotransferase (APT) family kinase protein